MLGTCLSGSGTWYTSIGYIDPNRLINEDAETGVALQIKISGHFELLCV